MQARHVDASSRAVSLDVDNFYAYVPFPPSKTLYGNKPALKNELGWPGAGSVVDKYSDFASLREAKVKKFSDGFTTGCLKGRTDTRTIYPKFKVSQMYRVANYAAMPPYQRYNSNGNE